MHIYTASYTYSIFCYLISTLMCFLHCMMNILGYEIFFPQNCWIDYFITQSINQIGVIFLCDNSESIFYRVFFFFLFLFLGHHWYNQLRKPIECGVDHAGTTLYRSIAWLVLSKYVWENIAEENYMCNIDPERTVLILQGNGLYNVVLIYLCWHCTRKLPLQCWPTANRQVSWGK